MKNPLRWLRWLWTPIAKNGTFFVFMFALGWMCTQLELMPYYLRVFCYVRFESTLTPTMLMLVAETSRQEAREFFVGYMNFAIITTNVGWILLLLLIHILWTFLHRWLNSVRQQMILPKLNEGVVIGMQALLGCLVAWCLYSSISQTWDNKTSAKWSGNRTARITRNSICPSIVWPSESTPTVWPANN